MAHETTILAGIEIPSTSPVFLTIVGFHILLGLVCVVTGAVAMLSPKGRGRHSKFGTIYYWCLFAIFVSATALSVMRWTEDYHLFFLGALSFASALIGRSAAQRQGPKPRLKVHIIGMGISYVLMITAFYVDNGKNLPLWKELPSIAYWLLPGAVGIPLIVRALLRHPLVRRPTA